MDFETTQKADYKPVTNHSPPKLITKRPQSSNSKLIGSSQYTADFVNWGSVLVTHQTRPQTPTRNGKLKFSAHTTYGDSFAKREMGERAALVKEKVVATQAVAPYVTTTQKDFRRSSSISNARVRPKKQEYQALKCAASHFKTESSQSFQYLPKKSIDPHALRRMDFNKY